MGELTFESMRNDVAALLGGTAGDDEDLLSLGLDSLSVMRLAAQWQSRGANIKFAELLERRTVAEWWQLVSSRLDVVAATVARPTDEPGPFDLAPMQRAYWIGRQPGQPLPVGSHVYMELDGRGVEIDRLERAVFEIYERHEMLRARITDDGRQTIEAQVAWPGLTVFDLRLCSAEARNRDLFAIREREAHRRLEVDAGRGFDVQLSLLPEGRTRVHVNIDMLCADALSFRILLSDLAARYLRPGEPLPPIELTYRQYLAEKRTRDEAAHIRARDYWLTRLEHLSGPPQLPTTSDPLDLVTPRVTRRELRLDAASWEALSLNAREHGVTLSMVFATAFAEVLAAWSARRRFLLNLPMFDRESIAPDVWRLVGDFTTSLLLDHDATDRASFAERALRLQAQFHAAAPHSAYGGIEVLRDLSRARDEMCGAPVVFTSALGIGELVDRESRGCLGALTWMVSQTAHVSLDHQVTEVDGALLLNWDVVEDLFPAGMIDAMFGAYVGMLDRLATVPQMWTEPVVVAPPDAQLAVRARANTTAHVHTPRSLHQEFFALAVRSPDRAAVVEPDGATTTYGELAGLARRIAGRLVERGIVTGDRVAISLPKGTAQIAAVLGVLYAGAAYVPLAVDHPRAYRDLLFSRAGARLLLAGESAVRDCLDAIPLPEAVELDANAAAYVLFTSGSTGTPKGVIVSHTAAASSICGLTEQFAIDECDRTLAVSALDFDLAVFDLFAPLSRGGAVVVIDEDARRDGRRWAAAIERHKVTVWQSVPMLLDMLLAAADPHELGSLRLAVLGGDWVALDTLDRLRAKTQRCALVALGGTTETVIHSTVQEVRAVDATWRSIPYGRPLPGVCCRVADELGNDRPDWVPGELWIGGAAVADGYLDEPARTCEVFVERGGVRWYRTGDRARYWPDGTLEFLGREDTQVKLRGHRIELGHIEGVLTLASGVERAVASIIDGRLVAAVVGGDESSVLAYARDHLPGYMVPQRIVVVDALPLSRNGKLDRNALARVFATRDPAPARAPSGDVEKAVARIWSELLRLDPVPSDRSFFELGGDSLAATRMVSRVEAAGLRGGGLQQLFAASTLTAFCSALVRVRAPQSTQRIFHDPAQRFEPFPLTQIQRAYWIGRDAGLALGGVGSYWYWEFDGVGVDVARLEHALDRLVRRHDMLRAVIDEDGRQRVLADVPRYVIAVDHTDDPTTALPALRAQCSHRLVDTTTWPLFEVRALGYGDRTRLAFGFDYVVLDALSIMLLFSELDVLYASPDAELRPLAITFRDYVVQAGVADPLEIAVADAYWARTLAELPPAPQLPLHVNATKLDRPRFVRHQGKLSRDSWAAIVASARARELTPNAVLATTFAEVLSTWSARPDLTINFTLFDRRELHTDVDRLVGDFTSLLLVPFRPQRDETWLSRAKRFQDELRRGLQHRSVSALTLLRELAKHRDPHAAAMPIVFTSTLGVGEAFELSRGFGAYAGGVSQTPQVWLDCQVLEADGELLFNWDAIDALFPDALVAEMFDAFTRRLELLASAETWTGPAAIALPASQLRVRAEANASERNTPEGRLHTEFFARAAAEPNAIALVWGEDQTLSYGALAEAALEVAGWLVGRGVECEEPVAVVLAKGADQIIAILGILAAGAAYVPIGIDQPQQRRDRIVRVSGVRIVIDDLTSTRSAPSLREPIDGSLDSLAYIIFTSGSTGEPKGVEITHRAAMTTIAEIIRRYCFTSADRVLALSPADFDLSVFDVFGLLAIGGSLVVVEEHERRTPALWAELAARWGATVWNSVPSLLAIAVEQTHVAWADALRLALISGDWMPLELPARLRTVAPACELVALGGATEAAIWSNAFDVTSVDPSWRSIPYGRPLAGHRFRVIGAHGRDCPDWVPGELCIGGAGLARGYRGDPMLTADRFIVSGERWYRTGDLARYWSDGTVELLGRIDHQVKLGGSRVELGEIEAVLGTCPGVAAATVIATGDRLRAIVGFVAAHGEVAPSTLRAHAAERLPAYMVPMRLHVLKRLPLTANGKIDRAALATLAQRLLADSADRPGDQPRGTLENAIASIWGELLAIPHVHRDSDFFMLGGDSLLAMRFSELLRRRRGIEVPLRDIVAASRLASLASLIAARAHDPDDSETGVI